MPDATQILVFIAQVLVTPLQLVGAFIAAFVITLFVIVRFKELVKI